MRLISMKIVDDDRPKAKLPEKFKKDWVAALRSGEYTQVPDYLHSDKGYCCLGVACEVSNAECWTGRNEHGGYFFTSCYSTDFPQTTDLDIEAYNALAAKVTMYAPSDINAYGKRVVMKHLAEMNDIGSTFEDIADWIEENL